ncbi:transferase family-domain-containing protein [Thelonectria olida]|uniref:Transferase family-domain-containing protein n=1 Tax=Thelonectria olida TaxID=1576542 RepID=A0A9P8W8I7_9HYPO|nr:transferase family-domain-containing protein [Thelonectria olida]
MADSPNVEVLTPLDLLMPKTYVQALLTFRTTESTTPILKSLQAGLDLTSKQVPWISGRIFQATSGLGGAPNLEVRWDVNENGPKVVDMGTIAESYETLSARGMLPEALPAGAWLVSGLPGEITETSGPRVLVAGLFRFGDNQGVGLCVGIHHNCVDGTGFAELVRLWVQNIPGSESLRLDPARGRLGRLSEALSSDSEAKNARSTESLLASHPEYSTAPPTFPSSFPACTSKSFTIPMARIQAHAQAVAGGDSQTPPTTNNVLCALLWSCITRARLQGSEAVSPFASSRMAMAVNGRPRIGSEFSTTENPYLGNVVIYSLSQLTSGELRSEGSDKLAKVCNTIAISSAPSTVNSGYVAEVCELVSKAPDYRGIFVGWDLFQSRDLTITSWANLDFYGMDFGEGLGKPEFIRFPYTEADGVCIILPRRRAAAGDASDEMIEVVVMLRMDNMAILEEDETWKSLVVRI